jgi:RNA polymerase sigma-70 factor (ECF subfamily)
VALHHGRLLGYTLRKIGLEWRGRIDAEDVLQEAYIQAFAHLPDFVCTDEESFHRWIVQIIENRFFDHVRHWKRKKRDVAREVGAAGDTPSAYERLLDQCHPEGQTPSAVLRREEARGALMSCIAQLPEDYQVVVRRVFLVQEPYETIGSDLGCSGEAVRRKASRAVAKLRECLGRASLYLSRLG